MFAPVPYDARFSPDWYKVVEAEQARERERREQEAKAIEAGRQQFYGQRPPRDAK